MKKKTSSLKSAGIAKIIIPMLKVLIGFFGLSVLFALLRLTVPEIYQGVELVDGAQTLLGIVLYLTVIISALVWIFKLHQDFRTLYENYPISPGKSLACFMIPIYSLWGIWHTLSTMAKQFKSDVETKPFGQSIEELLGFLYGGMAASRIINRVTLDPSSSNPNGENPFLMLLAALINLAVVLVFLKLAQAIAEGTTTKAKVARASKLEKLPTR